MEAPVTPHPFVAPPAARAPWLERHAGMLLAVPLVLLLLAWLNYLHPALWREPEPLRIKLLFEPAEPDPALAAPDPLLLPDPPADAAEPAALAFEDVAATRVAEVPAEAEGEPAEGTPEAVPLDAWVPTESEALEVEKLRGELNRKQASLDHRSQRLKESLISSEVQDAAKEFKLNSDGGLEGVIRLFDLEGYSEEELAPVLQRYDILFERTYTKPSAGRSYLNAAKTEQGTFSNAEKEGYYTVFRLSPKAVAAMARLEVLALQGGGYDPRWSRVREITFGIVRGSDGRLDIGVLDFSAERIR